MMRVLLLAISIFAAGSHAVVVQGKDLLSATTLTLDSAKAPIVLVFMSNHCPCSKSYEPFLAQLAQQFREFSWLGVVSNLPEDTSEARRYFEGVVLPFPILADGDQTLAARFGAQRTPHAFVLNAAGETVYAGAVGATHTPSQTLPISELYLARALEALRKGERIAVSQTRALGCPIRR